MVNSDLDEGCRGQRLGKVSKRKESSVRQWESWPFRAEGIACAKVLWKDSDRQRGWFGWFERKGHDDQNAGEVSPRCSSSLDWILRPAGDTKWLYVRSRYDEIHIFQGSLWFLFEDRTVLDAGGEERRLVTQDKCEKWGSLINDNASTVNK